MKDNKGENFCGLWDAKRKAGRAEEAAEDPKVTMTG